MNPHASSPATPNFDRLALVYRWMEWLSFGPLLQRCRCAFLNEIADRRSALVLGDGDGRFTGRLLKAAPQIRILAIDSSPAMLRSLLKEAGKNAGRVRTEATDIREWPQASESPYHTSFDLICTHFFLDCLSAEEICALISRIRPLLAANSMWVVSDFAVPKGILGRWVAGPLIRLLYWAFRWMTGLQVRRLPDHASALREAGFIREQRRELLGGMLCSETWRLQA